MTIRWLLEETIRQSDMLITDDNGHERADVSLYRRPYLNRSLIAPIIVSLYSEKPAVCHRTAHSQRCSFKWRRFRLDHRQKVHCEQFTFNSFLIATANGAKAANSSALFNSICKCHTLAVANSGKLAAETCKPKWSNRAQCWLRSPKG